jgi:hypothetical protein
MKYELIDQAEIDSLPEDDNAAFLAFERICREKLYEILNSFNQNDDWNSPRLRYITKVREAASEYGVPGWEDLPEPNAHNFQYEEFVVFDHEVTRIVTRLQIKNAKKRKAGTVKLPASRAADITKYVEALRRRIEGSDFDEKKKATLLRRLDSLKAELIGKGRSDLSKVLIIIASITTALNQAESAIIKLPDAIVAITKVIGLAKIDEDAARDDQAVLAAAPALKAIEDKRENSMQSLVPDRFAPENDDEIPF